MNEPLYKALKLQSTYRVRVILEGHIDNAIHHRLRWLSSQTGGTVQVYAESVSYGPWREITKEEFMARAMAILPGS